MNYNSGLSACEKAFSWVKPLAVKLGLGCAVFGTFGIVVVGSSAGAGSAWCSVLLLDMLAAPGVMVRSCY